MSELFIALIQAFGGPRPTSFGEGELYQALINAVTAFQPTDSWPAHNATGAGNLVAQTANTDTVGYTMFNNGSGGISIGDFGSGGLGLATNSTGQMQIVDNYASRGNVIGITISSLGTAANAIVISSAGGVQIAALNGTLRQLAPIVNVVTVSSNAGTVPITSKYNTFTNSSAAGMTITLTTTSAVQDQTLIVDIYDFSNVAQNITFVNTENSKNVSVPAQSAGSTTIPLRVGFMFNATTTKYTCVAVA